MVGRFLQMAGNLEQIACVRIAFRPEHADQAFRGCPDAFGEGREAYRGFDVIAQDGLARFHVAGQHGFDVFTQQ